MGCYHLINKKILFSLTGPKYSWFIAMGASIKETYKNRLLIKIKTFTLEEKKMSCSNFGTWNKNSIFTTKTP
jgi:hypothetical protein